jgi:hypothetical protein
MKKPAQISRIEQNQLATLALGENVYSIYDRQRPVW